MKIIWILFLTLQVITISAQLPKSYNVRWETPSKNSSESMPLGGGSVGLNVWVEKGDLFFYLSKSGAFDENNQFLKLGRCRLQLRPNPLDDPHAKFSQELLLNEGKVVVTAGETEIHLWVEVDRPLIHIEVESSDKIDVEMSYENWRMEDRLIPMNERSACFSYSSYAPPVYTYRDEVEVEQDAVLFYHRNRSDKLLLDFILDQQGLKSERHKLVNTQQNNTFGGLMQGVNFHYKGKTSGTYCGHPYQAFTIASKQATRKHHLSLALAVEQAPDLFQWKDNLRALAKQTREHKKAYKKNQRWWKQFWSRSYIYVNLDRGPQDKGFQIGRNYQLFRYMLACNAYGDYPTKFNGGLFTFDAQFTPINNQVIEGTPDYRAWGGGSHTAQNQRLVYWPMLKSGDFDMMQPQFEFYNRSYKNAEVRVKHYWGHAGCCFTEHPETFGLPAAASWGFDHAPRLRADTLEMGIQYNPWVQYHYTNQLEFAFMMLQYAHYTGASISKYLPFIDSALTFFFEHYKYRQIKRTGMPYDANGKLVIYPSTACETFKNVKNPTDLSAALIATIRALINLPKEALSNERRQFWATQLERVPPLTYGIRDGKRVLLPAKDLPPPINRDLPELYPLFPYGLLGIGRAEVEVAIDTWRSGLLDTRKHFVSWHQDAIFCARMGLADEAMAITEKKLSDAPRRFPAFWGPGHDYVPDHNWGGSGMIGLQEMLLQTDREENIMLLPAWPEEYDVSFRLHASKGRIVEVVYRNGKIISKKGK